MKIHENTRKIKQVKKNRTLSQIINCIKFCGKLELTLRGHDEGSSFENPRGFKGIINLVAIFDPSLQTHL